MFSFRLVRPGLFTRLRSFRYVLWVTVRLSFISILCVSISAIRSTFSKALPRSSWRDCFSRPSVTFLPRSSWTAHIASTLGFLTSFKEEVEIVTDAPLYDWELFCDLVYYDGRWPRIVRNFPTDATTLSPTSDGEELPHHALLDARIIAGMFAQ